MVIRIALNKKNTKFGLFLNFICMPNNRKYITLLLMYFAFLFQAQSQNINQVTGLALDNAGEKLAGNVFVLNHQDSSFITGSSFFDGLFSVDGLDDTKYIVKVTSLGYDDVYFDVNYTDNSIIDLGELVLNQAVFALDGVEVTALAPEVTQRADGVVEVKIENTILENSASTSEILRNAPNIVEINGNFNLFGRGEAIIYLNGKRVDNNRLSTIAPEQVKKVEIISNPSAKFDAQGMGVINIITKGGASNGFNIMLRPVITYSKFAGALSQNGVSFNSMQGKFSFIGNYMYRVGKHRRFYNATRDRTDPSDFFSSTLTEDTKNDIKNISNYNLGVSYAIAENSNVSLEYGGSFENIGGTINSSNNIVNPTSSNNYGSDIDLDEIDKKNSVTLNYNLSTDDKGSSLFIGGQFSSFVSPVNNLITENNDAGINNRTFYNIHDRAINITSFQGDFVQNLGEKISLELGAKVSTVKDESIIDFEAAAPTDEELPLNGYLKYEEFVPAGYVNLNGSFNDKKITYRIGGRAEYTTYDLNSSNKNETFSLGDKYLDFFPNLLFIFKIKETTSLNFSFASRIQRPPYHILNPNPLYQDRFTSREGDPNLIPAKISSFEIGFKSKILTAKASYIYSQNPFEAGALQGDGPNEYVLKNFNLEEKHQYLATVSKNFNFKNFSSSNTVSVRYSDWRDNTFGFQAIESRPHFYFYTGNNYKILKTLSVGITAWYLGRNFGGLYHWYPRSNVAFNIKKSFLKEALNCSFTINDIFRKTDFAGEYAIGSTDITFGNRYNYSYFRLIVSYKFGKLKKNKYKNKSTGEAENRRVQ